MSNAHPSPSRSRTPSCVLASVTVGLEEFIEAQGGRSSEVLARAGLQARLYEQPNRSIPLSRYCSSMHEAARSTGNEHFGLWFGEQFAPEGLGLYGYHAICAPDLRHAVAAMQEFFPVFQRNSLLQLSRHDGLCSLEYRLLDGDIMDRRQDAELTVGMLVNVLKRALGAHWAPLEVHFQHPPLVDASQHRSALRCDVRFRQASNRILFRDSCLEQPMPDANPMLSNVTRGSLLELAAQARQALSVVQRVKGELVDLLPDGEASLEEVARRLHRSPRTLQRELAAERHSFKSLLDALREELALHYLDHERLNISQIAYRLGYSEVSAFTRAFLRWKDMTPSDWRAR